MAICSKGKGRTVDRPRHSIVVPAFFQRDFTYVEFMSVATSKCLKNNLELNMKHTLSVLFFSAQAEFSYSKNNLCPKVNYPCMYPFHYILTRLNNHSHLGQLNQENPISISIENFIGSQEAL